MSVKLTVCKVKDVERGCCICGSRENVFSAIIYNNYNKLSPKNVCKACKLMYGKPILYDEDNKTLIFEKYDDDELSRIAKTISKKYIHLLSVTDLKNIIKRLPKDITDIINETYFLTDISKQKLLEYYLVFYPIGAHELIANKTLHLHKTAVYELLSTISSKIYDSKDLNEKFKLYMKFKKTIEKYDTSAIKLLETEVYDDLVTIENELKLRLYISPEFKEWISNVINGVLDKIIKDYDYTVSIDDFGTMISIVVTVPTASNSKLIELWKETSNTIRKMISDKYDDIDLQKYLSIRFTNNTT